MTDFYLKSGSGVVPYANQVWSSGDRMVPTVADATTNAAVAKAWVWEVTTAGTSTATPTWPASVTIDVTTVTDNGVVWTARRPGWSDASTPDWTFATPYALHVSLAATGGASDNVWVSNNHAESHSAAAYTVTFTDGVRVVCVDDGAAPPTTLATTGSITTTTNRALSVKHTTTGYIYGLVLSCGTGGTAASLTVDKSQYENCQFILGTTSNTSRIASSAGYFDWTNCSVKFGAAGQFINVSTSSLRWRGGSLLSGGTSPTALIGSVAGSGAPATEFLVENVDLTNANAAINLCNNDNWGARGVFRNMRLPASWSGSLNSATVGVSAQWVLNNCDNSGTSYRLAVVDAFGSTVNETTLVRTSGANDGTTPLSWKMVTGAGAGQFPINATASGEIVKWNGTTGSAITVTVEILHDSATALTDKEVWLEVSYLGTSGAPLGTLITDAAADVLATPADQTASAATWTTTGLTNPNTQKLSVTFTPQIAGFIHAVVKLCKASKTIYVCPELDIAGVTGLVQRQIPGGQYVNVDRAGMLAIPDMAGT